MIISVYCRVYDELIRVIPGILDLMIKRKRNNTKQKSVVRTSGLRILRQILGTKTTLDAPWG